MGLFDGFFGRKPDAKQATAPVESPERHTIKLNNFLMGTLYYGGAFNPYSRIRKLHLSSQFGISGIETLLDLTPEAIRSKYGRGASREDVPVEDILAAIATDQKSVQNFFNAANRSQDNVLTETLTRPWLNYAVALGYHDFNRAENFPDYIRAEAAAKANPDSMKRIFSIAMKHIAVTPFSSRTIDMMAYIPYGSQHGLPPAVASDSEFLRGVSGFVLKNLEQGVFLSWTDAILSTQSPRYLAPDVADVVKQHKLARDMTIETKFAEQQATRS